MSVESTFDTVTVLCILLHEKIFFLISAKFKTGGRKRSLSLNNTFNVVK